MADPSKDNAATSPDENQAGAPSGAPAASEESKGGTENASTSEASTQQTPEEELENAVLEADAAEIIDEAEKVVSESAEVEKAKQEAKDWQDKYMRLHAEWDTYRRRMNDQREQEKALASEKLVEGLIPIIDDLERSIDYAEQNGESGLLDGVKAVNTKFVDALIKDGVEVIDPLDEPFDALEAQAVGTVDDPTKPDETVAAVFQKGYKIKNKVLRPAMVTVTTGGPKREKKEEDQQ